MKCQRSGLLGGLLLWNEMEARDFDIDQLYADYGAAIFRFCYRLSGDRARAEDLAQDVFVVALRSKQGFRHDASPKTWLYGIAVNLVRKSRRRQILERAVRLAGPPPSGDPERLIDLGRAIDGLPGRLREPFVLVKVEGLSSAEAGAVLGLPEGTVRAQVHEAIQQLRRHLAPCSRLSEEISHAV
ncbi:RNA polymerase sigma factor [soil metagenome]